MMASSSSNTANNDLVKLESNVVDNSSSKTIENSVGGRKSDEFVAELVKLSSDEESSEDVLSLVEDSEEEEDSDFEEEESSDEEEEDEEEGTNHCLLLLFVGWRLLDSVVERLPLFLLLAVMLTSLSFLSSFSSTTTPFTTTEEENRERIRILEDTMKLKKMADFFAHPEKPVEMDGFSCARNVFSQPWAAETLDEDYDEERAQILADALAMKKTAVMYRHPERPLEVDATACARNYFSQPWAAEQETFGQAEARALAIGETKALKKLAVLYHHPEAPLEVDPACFGRNYFTRATAEDQTDPAEEQERALVLADAMALKKTAAAWLHPEAPLQVDPTVFGRNYFGRASAADQEEDELADERAIILEEMKELKQAAVDFMHPELAIPAMDAAAFGRNYYSRPSAEETEASATVDERQRILEEVSQLKQLAKDYLHPEAPVQIDATGFGRNYFGRPSADDQEDEEDEREQILQDMKALKQNAIQYRHPEKPLEIDPTVFGRNYFGRASAADKESFAAAEERARIIAEATQLKKMATMYLHPELPVETDACAFGRNYYSRPSAEEYESVEESQERARVLEEAANLKRLAVDYRHPEKPLEVDPACFGRNYFGRASAEEQEEDEYSDDREIILEEMAELKQAALDYRHPERKIVMDPTLCGRNYFERASAPEQESFEEAEERARVLAEASSLKKLAVDFAHPELPLAISDATAGARNYFTRPSAPGDSFEEAQARDQVLEDAARLKKLAADYLHPERAVEISSTACARSYFSRASAPEQISVEEEEERSAILAEASALKKLAVAFRHPELPVQTDAAAFGRNYFARSSALGVAEHISSSGHANPTEHDSHAEEHSHHDDYGHFDMDEDLFYDMRQTIVLPGETHVPAAAKIQSSKISSDEEGELSRSPSSIMLFTGAYDDENHPALPSMG